MLRIEIKKPYDSAQEITIRPEEMEKLCLYPNGQGYIQDIGSKEIPNTSFDLAGEDRLFINDIEIILED